jgi:uncharacterized DUF497 family protein
MNFEYDPAKSVSNLEKHGIDFEQAQELWRDEQALVVSGDVPFVVKIGGGFRVRVSGLL